jgi:hypothetical protein
MRAGMAFTAATRGERGTEFVPETEPFDFLYSQVAGGFMRVLGFPPLPPS